MKALGKKGYTVSSNCGHFIGKGLPWNDPKIKRIAIAMKSSEEYLVVFSNVQAITKSSVLSFGQSDLFNGYHESPFVFLTEDDYSLSIAKHLLDDKYVSIGIHKIRVIDKQCIESITIESDYLFMIEEHKKMLQAKTEMEKSKAKKEKPSKKSKE